MFKHVCCISLAQTEMLWETNECIVIKVDIVYSKHPEGEHLDGLAPIFCV